MRNFVNSDIVWQHIAEQISNVTARFFNIDVRYTVTGGCINDSFRIEGNGQNYFVKINEYRYHEMFCAEADGLAELSQPAVIKVPLPICWGTIDECAYLVTEYITLCDNNSLAAGTCLGEQLAMMHQVSKVPFGWHRDNYIGSTQQPNVLTTNWVDFWREQRLGYQLALAARKGFTSNRLQEQGKYLMDNLHLFFTSYHPKPSLLHGDLWSGNYSTDINGAPIIFDPAVYYGDRETDIAMTELFGGFPPGFYDAYQSVLPLDPGYAIRKHIYNLYHILNHLNLFGGGYLSQAESMIDGLLSEL